VNFFVEVFVMLDKLDRSDDLNPKGSYQVPVTTRWEKQVVPMFQIFEGIHRRFGGSGLWFVNILLVRTSLLA